MDDSKSILYNILLMLKDGVGKGLYHPFMTLADVSRYFAPSLIVLYLVVIAYKIIVQKEVRANLYNILRLVVLVPIVIHFCFNLYNYKKYLVDPVLNVNETIYFAILDLDNKKDPFEKISNSFKSFFIKLENTSLSWWDGLAKLVQVVVFFVSIYTYYLLGKYMILGIIWMYMAFMIGPIAILAVVFDSTRGVFFAWVKTLATYFLYPILVSIVMINVNMTLSYIGSLTSANSELKLSITALVLLLIVNELINQIPNFANAITGGNSQSSSVGEGTKSLLASMAGRGAGVGANLVRDQGKKALDAYKAYKAKSI